MSQTTSSLRVTVTAVALALAGLTGAAQAAHIPAGVKLAAKQELIRNNGSEPETLDPALVESVGAQNLAEDLFEGLTTTDNEGKLQPGVAMKWERKDDTTWVFHLRKNAKWSNGDQVVAGDFVYSWQRFLDPKTASPYATTYGVFILNGKDIADGKKPTSELGVKALDNYTLEVKTDGPVAFLPALMANAEFYPENKAVIEKFGKDWTKPGKMVSNGAFVLQDWQVNSKIVMTKNATYWDAKNVQLTKVTYLPVEDEGTDVKLFESGQNDMVYQLPSGQFAKFLQQNPKEVKNSTMLGLRYYSFNVKDPVLKDVRVRKALSMVLDRDLLAKVVTADGQVPAYSVIVKGLSGADVTSYDWVKWPMAQRVAEAKKLLAQAGVKPGTHIHFAYNNSEYHKKMAIFAASEWKTKLGLDTDMDAMEFKVLLKKRHALDYQIARNGWVADFNDATDFLTLVQCGSDQNDSGYCNQKADALMKQGNASTDQAKRKVLLTQAAKVMMDDYPVLPLLQYTLPRMVKSYVGGYSTKNPVDRYVSKDLYIAQH